MAKILGLAELDPVGSVSESFSHRDENLGRNRFRSSAGITISGKYPLLPYGRSLSIIHHGV